jgi:hypothetical protein
LSERPDEYYVGRIIGRVRLLIATSDDIPVETKLETQPMLKAFEASLAVPPGEQDQERVRGQYAFLCEALEDQANIDALLRALKNFVPYL